MQNLPPVGSGPSRRPEPLPGHPPGTPAPRLDPRWRRRALAAVAALAAAAAVAATVALPGPADDGPPAGAAARDGVPAERPPDTVLGGPPRGSLAGDAAVLEALLRHPWGTPEDPPVDRREVVLATDTPAGRVALVVADGYGRSRGVWLTGPAGAAAADLVAWEPDRGRTGRPATLLLAGPEAAVLVAVAARGDVLELSPRLAVDASGAAAREWTAVPSTDGTAVVPVADVTAGLAAALTVRRDGEVVHRTGFPLPAVGPRAAEPLDLVPLRPGDLRPDPALVGEAVRRAARPLGVAPSALRPRLLGAAGLTRTGGLGAVVVLTVTTPDGGGLVTTHARLGPGREIPCGTVPLAADVRPGSLTAAAVCSVFDGIEVEADRSWLVVTAPPAAVRAEVLDEAGVVLDTVDLAGGGSVGRAPDGTVAVRTLDAAGRPLDVARVPGGEPFGGYGEDG